MRTLTIALLFSAFVLHCGKGEQQAKQEGAEESQAQTATEQQSPRPAEVGTEPDHIEVQHILIAFKGSIPGKNITRSQAEAQQLALEVLALANQGEDFDALVRKYTDDSYPGRYKMSNLGVPSSAGEYPRNRMVAAFGDVGFKLEVGAVGLANYDRQTSPYGWHIIKRLQ